MAYYSMFETDAFSIPVFSLENDIKIIKTGAGGRTQPKNQPTKTQWHPPATPIKSFSHKLFPSGISNR